MLIMSCSERKWKEKLKDWSFQKYLPPDSMLVIVAKADKRKLHEGKETVFFLHGAKIASTRIETSKKRKITKAMDMTSPNACK